MPKKVVEVIILSSDEDSNSQVENVQFSKNTVKAEKVTPRKTMPSKVSSPSSRNSQPTVPKTFAAQAPSNSLSTSSEKKTARKATHNNHTSRNLPKMVTSPKLSLKRKGGINILQPVITTPVPLPFSPSEPPSKKPKIEDRIPKVIPLQWIPKVEQESSLATNPVKESESMDIDSNGPQAETVIEDRVTAPSSKVEPRNGVKENSKPWGSTDDNDTRFRKLLDFSKPFMVNSLQQDIKKIVQGVLKAFDRADPSYIESLDFRSLMDETLESIKSIKISYVPISNIKTQLKANKRRKQARRPSIGSELSSETVSITSNPPEVTTTIESTAIESTAIESTAIESTAKESIADVPVQKDATKQVPTKDAPIVKEGNLANNSNPSPTNKESPKKSVYVEESIPSTSKQADIFESEGMPVHPDGHNDIPDDHQREESIVEKDASKKEVLMGGLNLQSVNVQPSNGAAQSMPQPPSNAESNQKKESASTSKSKEDKIEKQVRRLEVFLGKLDKKIRKLQAKELTLDDLDDEDSTYVQEERYKKKFNKVWLVLCKLKKTKALVGREIDRRFSYEGSRHAAFNKAIEKLINKRKPSEKFPYYAEVHNLLKKVNEQEHLALSPYEIESEAKSAFKYVGSELKRRREKDDDRDFGCYLTDNISLETDPAEQDEELKIKLANSAREGEKKIAEIIDKYAAQQRGDPNAENDEGSDCDDEETGSRHGEDKEEAAISDVELQCDTPPEEKVIKQEDPPTDGSLEEPVIVEVKEGDIEDEDLPETAPATPETDEREDLPPTPPVALTRPIDVIDVDSSSSGSTDPGPNADERRTSFKGGPFQPIIIHDGMEIAGDRHRINDDGSPGLPSLEELLNKVRS